MAKENYVIDQKGRKKAVLLPIQEYEKMQEELEDLKDSIELEDRARTAKVFIPYDRVRKRLKAAGKL